MKLKAKESTKKIKKKNKECALKKRYVKCVYAIDLFIWNINTNLLVNYRSSAIWWGLFNDVYDGFAVINVKFNGISCIIFVILCLAELILQFVILAILGSLFDSGNNL